MKERRSLRHVCFNLPNYHLWEYFHIAVLNCIFSFLFSFYTQELTALRLTLAQERAKNEIFKREKVSSSM